MAGGLRDVGPGVVGAPGTRRRSPPWSPLCRWTGAATGSGRHLGVSAAGGGGAASAQRASGLATGRSVPTGPRRGRGGTAWPRLGWGTPGPGQEGWGALRAPTRGGGQDPGQLWAQTSGRRGLGDAPLSRGALSLTLMRPRPQCPQPESRRGDPREGRAPTRPVCFAPGDSSTVRCLPTAVTDQAYCRAPLPAPVPTESQGVSCPARSCSLPTCRRHLRATLQAALGTEHVRGEGQPGRAGARTGGHPHGPFSASDLPSEGGEAGDGE